MGRILRPEDLIFRKKTARRSKERRAAYVSENHRRNAKGIVAARKGFDRIFPVMQARGGYLSTCDHGVPAEISPENERYFRKRRLEFA